MQVSEFKTSAWQSKERADTYHTATVAAPKVLELLRHDLYLRYIHRYAPTGAKILDLGCGTGLISSPLHDAGYQVVACDASQAMLNRASENFGSRSIELRLGSGFNIPASDGEFDMVISRMFIAHFPDWPRILREKARVTRPGGIVFFDFGNREHLVNAGLTDELSGDFPYGTDASSPENFYAVASTQEMHATASQCALDVADIVPHGFLLYNKHFWQAVGRQGVDQFNAKLDGLLQDEKARALLLLLEESFIPHLPKLTTYGNLVILRRTSDPLPVPQAS